MGNCAQGQKRPENGKEQAPKSHFSAADGSCTPESYSKNSCNDPTRKPAVLKAEDRRVANSSDDSNGICPDPHSFNIQRDEFEEYRSHTCTSPTHALAYVSASSPRRVFDGRDSLRGCPNLQDGMPFYGGETNQVNLRPGSSLSAGNAGCHFASPSYPTTMYHRERSGISPADLSSSAISPKLHDSTAQRYLSAQSSTMKPGYTGGYPSFVHPNYSFSAGNSIAHGIARGSLESPLTIDYGSQRSDGLNRSSLIIDPEHTPQKLRTVSTTPTMLLTGSSAGQRSSVGGLSGRYLVHQPYFLSSKPSPSRSSLGSTGPNSGKLSRNKGVVDTFDHQEEKFLVAIFDYETQAAEEISVRKGDKLRVLDNSDPEWWLVEHTQSGLVGYVPTSYLAMADSVEAEDWYFRSISRKDSERLLLLKGNIRGTFLIRESETTNGALSLSVRDIETQRGDTVKHYKIRKLDNGDVYITTKQILPDLKALVLHYSKNADGLCCCLTRPCPRPPPVPNDLSRLTRDQWEIPRSSLELIERLGAGQFGEVWRGKWNDSTEVAIKTLKPGTMSREDFLKEARIMKRLHHPRLVRLYAVVTAEPIYIVTELMPLGSLLHYLRDGAGQDLELRPLVDMMAQIASGMAYLEKERYVHRDLAARNILVGDNNTVKIADFGLARIIDSGSETYTAKQGAQIPIKWTAPEAALMGRFTVKSDVWSFGIVIYEIITHGKVPYPSMNNTETLQQVESGYRMPRPPNCPPTIYEMVLSMWDVVPERRPTFEFLCGYFEDYFANAERSYRPPDETHTPKTQNRLPDPHETNARWIQDENQIRLQKWENWRNSTHIPSAAAV
ncbi:unnamed protein product [Calicophoron daubneyi]|uniref:Tyrosine-protein kinase n=1 Tax=Calicophoron daubneyi TaxID=300641 RepID=A0AAV2TU97_CALDB